MSFAEFKLLQGFLLHVFLLPLIAMYDLLTFLTPT